MPLVGHSPEGLGIANGVVVVALLDQFRAILNSAIDGLKPLATRSVGVQDALNIIREEMLSRFERGIIKKVQGPVRGGGLGNADVLRQAD